MADLIVTAGAVGGQPVFEWSDNPGVTVTDLAQDGGDLLAKCAAWIDQRHTKLNKVPLLSDEIVTFLGAASSANLLAAMTTKTGTGNLVFGTNCVLVAPNIGTPSAGNLTNCTNYEGTAVKSTGQTTGRKVLTEKGDGTSEWREITHALPARGDAKRIAADGSVHEYRTTNAGSATANAEAFQDAIDNIANGDILLLGPGEFESLSGAGFDLEADDLQYDFSKSFFKRKDNTSANAVVTFTGARIRGFGGHVDCNRENNLIGYNGSTNRNNGIELYGSDHYHVNWFVEKVGQTGYGFWTEAGLGGSIVLRDCRGKNAGYATYRIRGQDRWLINCDSDEPNEYTQRISNPANATARKNLTFGTGPGEITTYEGCQQDDDHSHWMLTGDTPSDDNDWTQQSQHRRHITDDAVGAGIEGSMLHIWGGFWQSDSYANVVIDAGDTTECELLDVDGLTCINAEDNPEPSTAAIKVDWYRNTVIRNTKIKNVGGYSMAFWFSPARGVANVTLENVWCSGSVDCNNQVFNTLLIERTMIGGEDEANIGIALDYSARNLIIRDSTIQGSSANCIVAVSANSHVDDYIEVTGSILGINRPDDGFAFIGINAGRTVIDNNRYFNSGGGEIYRSNAADDRIRFTGRVSNVYEFDEEAETKVSTRVVEGTSTSIKLAGVHNGGDGEATLSDSTRTWSQDELANYVVHNVSDGSSGKITANAATTATAVLKCGTNNDWDDDDIYMLDVLRQHDGSDGDTRLRDQSQRWIPGEHVGKTIYNITDGSSATITSNTESQIYHATLTGGSGNDWDSDDAYRIGSITAPSGTDNLYNGDRVKITNTGETGWASDYDGDTFTLTMPTMSTVPYPGDAVEIYTDPGSATSKDRHGDPDSDPKFNGLPGFPGARVDNMHFPNSKWPYPAWVYDEEAVDYVPLTIPTDTWYHDGTRLVSTVAILVGTTTAPGGSATKAIILGDNAGNPEPGTDTAGYFVKIVDSVARAFVVDEDDTISPLTKCYGQISIEGNSSALTISNSSTDWTNAVQIAFDTAGGTAQGVTESTANNDLVCDIAGVYLITLEVSFSGSASDKISGAIFKNNKGTQLGTRFTETLDASGNVTSATITTIASLAVTDTVEGWAQNETDSDNITVEDAVLSMVRIG